MIHSPSKYTSLARLKQIKKDNCIGATGKEYSEYEIEQLIQEKENNLASWWVNEAEEYFDSIAAERSSEEYKREAAATRARLVLGSDKNIKDMQKEFYQSYKQLKFNLEWL